jgi:uncharacterized protein (TIGR04255 family)
MKLEKAPLVHVLAQVAYTPVLSIAEYIPTIQSRFIALGFPRLQEGATHEVIFASGSPPSTSSKRRWDFLDRDQQTGFVLTESSFVLQTSVYESHEPFLECLRQGLEVLKEIVGVTLVDRLGMRYIDRVVPEAGEAFGAYVDAGLLGFPFRGASKLQANLVTFATQSVAITPSGVLAIRSALLPPNQLVPPDLEQGPLQYPPSSPRNQAGLSVDFDHFSVFTGPNSTPFDFVPSKIVDHMTLLHLTLRSAFDVIATPYAVEKWGPWQEVSTV